MSLAAVLLPALTAVLGALAATAWWRAQSRANAVRSDAERERLLEGRDEARQERDGARAELAEARSERDAAGRELASVGSALSHVEEQPAQEKVDAQAWEARAERHRFRVEELSVGGCSMKAQRGALDRSWRSWAMRRRR